MKIPLFYVIYNIAYVEIALFNLNIDGIIVNMFILNQKMYVTNLLIANIYGITISRHSTRRGRILWYPK